MTVKPPSLADRPQCPHGENCACIIMTRHEWHESYCRSAEIASELRAELRAMQRALIEALAVPRPRRIP